MSVMVNHLLLVLDIFFENIFRYLVVLNVTDLSPQWCSAAFYGVLWCSALNSTVLDDSMYPDSVWANGETHVE